MRPKRCASRVYIGAKLPLVTVLVGTNPKGVRGVYSPCITSWVFGERVIVSIHSRFSLLGVIIFFSLFLHIGFLDSIVYLCQSMKGKPFFGRVPKRLSGCGGMESPFFLLKCFQIIIAKTQSRYLILSFIPPPLLCK